MDMFKFLEQAETDKDTSVVARAKEKLQTEIEQSKNNPYIKTVGEYLIKELNINTELAEKIANTDKTIAKSLDAMKNEASKKKVGNMAMFTPEEGFGIVLKYYGIKQ